MLACGMTPKSEYVSGRATDSLLWKPHTLGLSPSTFFSSQCFATTLSLRLCPNSCRPWSLVLVSQNTVLSRSQDALQLQTIKMLLRPLELSLGKPWYLSWAFLPGTQKQQPLCLQEHRGHMRLWMWREELKGGVKADMEKNIRELARSSGLALDLHFPGWTQTSTSPVQLSLS